MCVLLHSAGVTSLFPIQGFIIIISPLFAFSPSPPYARKIEPQPLREEAATFTAQKHV